MRRVQSQRFPTPTKTGMKRRPGKTNSIEAYMMALRPMRDKELSATGGGAQWVPREMQQMRSATQASTASRERCTTTANPTVASALVGADLGGYVLQAV